MAKRTYGKYSGKNPTEKLTDARQALFDALLADMEREGPDGSRSGRSPIRL